MISVEQKDQFLRTVGSALRNDPSGATMVHAIRRFAAKGMDERSVTKLLGILQRDLNPGEDEIFQGVMDIVFGYAGIGQAVFPEPHYDLEVINKARPLPRQVTRERTDEFHRTMMTALQTENPREQMVAEIKKFAARGMNQAAMLWCLIYVDRDAEFEHWDIVWDVVKMTANIGEVKYQIFPDQPNN